MRMPSMRNVLKLVHATVANERFWRAVVAIPNTSDRLERLPLQAETTMGSQAGGIPYFSSSSAFAWRRLTSDSDPSSSRATSSTRDWSSTRTTRVEVRPLFVDFETL